MIALEEAHGAIGSILEGQIAELPATPNHELGEACHELSRFYRVAGVCALLCDYDTNAFQHMLTRSAITRIRYLEKVQKTQLPIDRYSKVSRTDALFDAFAVSHWDLAGRIAELGPRARVEKYEYEDDYWYALFFVQVALRRSEAELEQTLGALEASLNGADARRAAVGKAVLSGEQDAFDTAFEGLLKLRKEELQALERSGGRHEFEFVGAKHIFVEGLGILRVAEKRGLKTEAEYPLCPAEARVPASTPFAGDMLPRF